MTAPALGAKLVGQDGVKPGKHGPASLKLAGPCEYSHKSRLGSIGGLIRRQLDSHETQSARVKRAKEWIERFALPLREARHQHIELLFDRVAHLGDILPPRDTASLAAGRTRITARRVRLTTIAGEMSVKL